MTEFEKLFSENREFIFKFLMKTTRDASLAEELTQETFFRAYINYASLRSREKAPAWLCTIARNAYYAWCNEQKKHAPLEEAEDMSDGKDPEEELARSELSREALRSLRELEEPYKEVLSLFVFGGLSHKQIGSAFGKSESWSRVTFYRAKQKLLERMKK